MRFSSFHLYAFSTFCSLLNRNREGIILVGMSDQGEQRFGELSPLPGFSIETLNEVISQLTSLLPSLVNKEFDPSQFLQAPLWPSVHFALFCLNLPNLEIQAPLSGFIYLPYFPDDLSRLLSLGIKEAKIKIPKMPIRETINQLKECLAIAQGNVLLHLDVNRNWSLDDWELFSDSFPSGSFQYVEEPLLPQKLSLSLMEKSKHPISFDESLREDPALLSLHPHSIIVKPTLDSSFPKILKTASSECIISSSLETSVGTKSLCQIHGQTSSKFAVGADTLRYLDSSLFPYDIDKGCIYFPCFSLTDMKSARFLCTL